MNYLSNTTYVEPSQSLKLIISYFLGKHILNMLKELEAKGNAGCIQEQFDQPIEADLEPFDLDVDSDASTEVPDDFNDPEYIIEEDYNSTGFGILGNLSTHCILI